MTGKEGLATLALIADGDFGCSVLTVAAKIVKADFSVPDAVTAWHGRALHAAARTSRTRHSAVTAAKRWILRLRKN